MDRYSTDTLRRSSWRWLNAATLLKSTAKAALKTVSPSLLNTASDLRMRWYWKRRYGPLQDKVRAKLYGKKEMEVLNGPFKGLKFDGASQCGWPIPMWVGTYESQLHSIIEWAVNSGEYQTIINVGAAEGYYSVGLARLLSRTAIFSYDIDSFARRVQRKLARANGVRNLSINGRCSYEELTRRIQGRTLIICDIEGFEYELLDPSKCPAIVQADILLELHPIQTNWAEAGRQEMIALTEAGRQEMLARFGQSHSIQGIQETPPDPKQFEFLSKVLSSSEIQIALQEPRSFPMSWLWMQSSNRGSG